MISTGNLSQKIRESQLSTELIVAWKLTPSVFEHNELQKQLEHCISLSGEPSMYYVRPTTIVGVVSWKKSKDSQTETWLQFMKLSTIALSYADKCWLSGWDPHGYHNRLLRILSDVNSRFKAVATFGEDLAFVWMLKQFRRGYPF